MQDVQDVGSQENTTENKFKSEVEVEVLASPQKVVPTKQVAAVRASEDGRLVGSSLDEQYRLAKAYSSSGLMPKALNSPEKVLVALQICAELGLPPMTSVSKIAVINGTASLFGDLPLSLVWKSGYLESIKEEFVMDGEEVRGAKCTVKRKGQEPATREFLEVDAKKAGLLGKGVWSQYPKRMYQYRARAWALKDVFPDVLNGISISEWDHNSDGETRDVSFESNPDVNDIKIKEKTELDNVLDS